MLFYGFEIKFLFWHNIRGALTPFSLFINSL